MRFFSARICSIAGRHHATDDTGELPVIVATHGAALTIQLAKHMKRKLLLSSFPRLPAGALTGLCWGLFGLWLCGPVQPLLAQRTLAIVDARIETAGKAGVIDNGTLLVRDGKITAVGSDVQVPVSAQIIQANGRTVTPGFVDPYYVVPIGRKTQSSAVRTIVFRGRTFIIGGSSPSIATTFAKVADGWDPTEIDWSVARRSGITTLHVVASGYAQSLLAKTGRDAAQITKADGSLLVSVTNSTKSLNVLRVGMKPPSSSSRSSSSRSSSSSRTTGAPTSRPTSTGSAPTSSSSSRTSPTTALWADVRSGKAPVFVNVNNAAAILHVDQVMSEHEKTKVALITSGANAYLAREQLDPKKCTVILSPRISEVPNSRYRINVPSLLASRKVPFAFSLSLAQTEFRQAQDTPLFGLAVLVRGGLDRQQALRALTIEPARLLGVDKQVGSLEVGKQANFLIFDGDPLEPTTALDRVFVEGKPLDES